jgi:signal peptidase I
MAPTTDTLFIAEIGTKSKLREYTEVIVVSLLSALIIRTCVIQSFKIPSGSMENTLIVGDCLLVNKFIYGIKIPFTDLRLPALRNPQRGDIVVFRYPLDRSQDYIKRIIGVPGDQIQIRQKQVYVNGIPFNKHYEIHTDTENLPSETSARDNFGPVQIPENSYFMMGDNRDNSYDSRFWGFVDGVDIVGHAFIKFWSWDKDAWRPRLNRIGKRIH